MASGPPGHVPSQRFVVTRKPVAAYVTGAQQQPTTSPANDLDQQLLENIAQNPRIGEQITNLTASVPVDQSTAFELPPEKSNSKQSEPAAASSSSSSSTSRQAPIGLSLQEQALLNGYRPTFGSLPPPDPGRIPRADGHLYSNDRPGERSYENKPDVYGKEWLRRQVAYQQALARDPMYHMAIQVAGRVGRRVLDLIQDPLEFAQPELVRPDPRLTVKEAYNPITIGATGRINTAAGVPNFYSRYKIIEVSLPEEQRDEYKRLMSEAAESNLSDDAKKTLIERAFVQILIGLLTKWNALVRDAKLPGVPPVQPTDTSTPEYLEAYGKAMSSVRQNLLKQKQDQLASLYQLPVTQLNDVQQLQVVSLRQDIAELRIIEERRWIEGAFEDQPGYEVVRAVYENAARNGAAGSLAMDATMRDWDALFNAGLFSKQRALSILAESRRNEDANAHQTALVQLLEGKGVTNLDQIPVRNAAPGRPAVNTRWMTLPENLGVIIFRENLQAAVDQSLSDIAGFAQKGDAPLDVLITEPSVSSFFFDLVATNFRIFEVQAPRRNEEFRLLGPLRQRRLELLLKFTLLQYNPVTDSLVFSDQVGSVFTGIGHLRDVFRTRGQRKRSSPALSDAQYRTVYDGKTTEAYKYQQLRTGSEIREFDRSKEFFTNFL